MPFTAVKCPVIDAHGRTVRALNEYSEEVRREARRLWLTGRMTDAEVAERLGITRADTIRDWRHQEGWVGLADDISHVLNDEVKARVAAQLGAFRTKYDQIGQAIESMAIRGMKAPGLSPRDLKALAGTLVLTQRMRDKALAADGQQTQALSVAEQFRQSRERVNRRGRGTTLGRCRTATGSESASIDADASARDTATRGE